MPKDELGELPRHERSYKDTLHTHEQRIRMSPPSFNRFAVADIASVFSLSPCSLSWHLPRHHFMLQRPLSSALKRALMLSTKG
jgi:hypothetical protein